MYDLQSKQNKNWIYNSIKNVIYKIYITLATSIQCMKDNISCMHSTKQKLKYNILQWTLEVLRLLPTFLFIQNYSED